MSQIVLPDRYNYVAAFLTLACNLRCSYCINLHEEPDESRARIATKHMTGDQWISALNRIEPRLPITLQGGEPTVHKDFYKIMGGVRLDHKFDLLTNMQFDPVEFVASVPVELFTREAPYAPIRVSYHPGQNDMRELLPKARYLQDHGFRVGLYGVLHPSQESIVLDAQEKAIQQGLDFRTKEYLGVDSGHFRYPDAHTKQFNKSCMCRTSELLIAPTGDVMRCHSDLYESRPSIGHILDESFVLEDKWRPCDVYGHCNPCDVKIKTNRHQIFGHTSCEIEMVPEFP